MPPDAEARAAPPPPVGRLIRGQRAIVALSLAGLAALAWLWLAGMPAVGDSGHSAMAMGQAPADVWSAAYLLPAFAMWTLMMVAMMLPSAAPMILLYGRMASRPGVPHPLAYTAAFTAAYLGIWTLFSAAAALAQAASVSTGLVSDMALAIGDARTAGALLVLAGLYQLSPIKQACLDQCRSPLSFIIRLSRPGASGALRIGLAHGLYCLGCCWALMLLLFVGGVMNLAWIAALTLIVLAEKLAPASFLFSRFLALLLIAGGAILFATG